MHRRAENRSAVHEEAQHRTKTARLYCKCPMPHPFLIFVLTFIGLSLSAWIGCALRRKQGLEEGLREDFGFILAATLTLLGLIIGFSFSMATSRYDQRKNYEEAEANAIGTEYARADLLPAADADAVRTLLRKYIDERIAFFEARDDRELPEIDARTARLHNELWTAVRGPVKAQPTPVAALVAQGMNDVLNSQGYTQASFWNQIPMAAWGLMAAVAICCNLLVGYGAHNVKGGAKLLHILPLVVAIAFLLIADIDAPRKGIIRVQPQNLISLAESLRASEGSH